MARPSSPARTAAPSSPTPTARLTRTSASTAWTDVTDPDLWEALADLDGRTRAALLLSVLDGYTQREIAAILGAPQGTVASWISRGRSALRARLGPDR